jgi:hypothetical protein
MFIILEPIFIAVATISFMSTLLYPLQLKKEFMTYIDYDIQFGRDEKENNKF